MGGSSVRSRCGLEREEIARACAADLALIDDAHGRVVVAGSWSPHVAETTTSYTWGATNRLPHAAYRKSGVRRTFRAESHAESRLTVQTKRWKESW